MFVNTHAQLADAGYGGDSIQSSGCPIQDWVDDSLCAACPPGYPSLKAEVQLLAVSLGDISCHQVTHQVKHQLTTHQVTSSDTSSDTSSSNQVSIPSCAKIPPRPKSSDYGYMTTGGVLKPAASGNKPHCDCNAGYGGSHCETKILNLEDLSITVADIEEEMEKMAESAVRPSNSGATAAAGCCHKRG